MVSKKVFAVFGIGALAYVSQAIAESKGDLVVMAEAEITAYCPCDKCCTPFKGKVRGVTASGNIATEGRTVAAPKILPFGTKIVLEGKTLIVEDRGGAIHSDDGRLRLDVYFQEHKSALAFGRKTALVQIIAK